MSSNWPVSKIGAIDPFPFHGLVYRILPSTSYRLDPRDGRPHINMPPGYLLGVIGANPGTYHGYAAHPAGALWDIGRADPETTPEIEAAGGRSLGRRLVSLSSFHPARIGDRTVQVQVYAVQSAGMLQLLWQLGTGGAAVMFAEYNVSTSFGINWATIRTESSLGLASAVAASPSYSLRALDTSPDGTRRLFGVTLAGNAGSNGWAASMVGMIEVELSAHPETGELQASAELIRTAADLLGTYTRSASGVARSLVTIVQGYPTCRLRYEAQEIPGQITGTDGSSIISRTRTDYVVGALYDAGAPGGIRYLTVNYVETDERSASHSKADWDWQMPDSEDEACVAWPGGAPPEPPRIQSSSHHYRFDLTLRCGDHEVSGWIDNAVTRSASAPGTGGTISKVSESVRTASGGFEQVVTGTESTGWDTITAYDNSDFDPTAVYLPQAVWRSSGPLISLVTRRSWLSIAVFGDYYTGGVGEKADCWWHPLLTPAGAVGGIVKYPIIRVGAGTTPDFRYDAAYNPMTGEAIRDCDVPGWRVEGYI
uniref:Uncharacterized protein n=1 Tax=Ectopseudomonas mendocina (strain ymp) TaxID=399739 RepID=A4XZD9_ECTM1